MKTPIKMSLGIIALLVCFGGGVLWTAWRGITEKHARSCLITITELADHTLTESIPQGNYVEATEAAEYIQGYYPVGTVLPREHRFADQYTSARSKQIDRLLAALRVETGMDYGMDWAMWRKKLANPKEAHPTADKS